VALLMEKLRFTSANCSSWSDAFAPEKPVLSTSRHCAGPADGCLPTMRWSRCLVDSEDALALRPLPVWDVGHRRDHLSGQSRTFDDLVPRHVADHQPKERHERLGFTTGSRPRQLQDGLGYARQHEKALQLRTVFSSSLSFDAARTSRTVGPTWIASAWRILVPSRRSDIPF